MSRRLGVTHPKGLCHVCDRMVALKDDGLMFMHRGTGPLGHCRGSNREPRDAATHTHRCPCGASWDEHADEPARPLLEAVT